MVRRVKLQVKIQAIRSKRAREHPRHPPAVGMNEQPGTSSIDEPAPGLRPAPAPRFLCSGARPGPAPGACPGSRPGSCASDPHPVPGPHPGAIPVG